MTIASAVTVQTLGSCKYTVGWILWRLRKREAGPVTVNFKTVIVLIRMMVFDNLAPHGPLIGRARKYESDAKAALTM